MSDEALLRDQFAAAALTGILAKLGPRVLLSSDPADQADRRRWVCEEAYAYADAMLLERCLPPKEN